MYKKIETEKELENLIKEHADNVSCCIRIDNKVAVSTLYDLRRLHFKKHNKYIELLINED